MEREAHDQRHREAGRAGRRRLADREPLAEVVHADADRDQECQALSVGQALHEAAALELVDRRGAGTDERGRAARRAALHPLRVVDEPHQAEREAGEPDRAEGGEGAPVASVELLLDRLDRPGEHVPEQEEEDARRKRAHPRTRGGAEIAQPSHRQPEEDRPAGDRAEEERLGGGHEVWFPCSRCKGHLTGTPGGNIA